MEKVVLNFFKKNQINYKKSKFLLAVSGGADSMCLAYVFKKLNLHFSIAHCNFNLRAEESEDDNSFVFDFCNKNDIVFFDKKFNTKEYCKNNSISTQMAARELRYSWFNNLVLENKMDFIVSAHHFDDDVETYLMNFIKGTGFRGLHGIKEKNGILLRPLISVTKEEILNFLKENEIKYREDSSNKSDVYYRNKIRNNVLPILLELNPAFKETISRNIKWMSEHEELVLEHIENKRKEIFKKNSDGSIKVDIEDLKTYLDKDIYIHEFFNCFGFNQNQELKKIVYAKTGKKIFSQSHVILKNRETLIISKNKIENYKNILISEEEKKVSFSGNELKLKISKDVFVSKDKNLCTIDFDKLKFPLKIRKWESGDYFYPFGMSNKKKVSDYLIDNKISLLDKNKIFVLCSGEDIICLIGHRVDNRYKVEQKTKKVYIVELN